MRIGLHGQRVGMAALLVAAMLPALACADDNDPDSTTPAPSAQRPAINFYRWKEDWSVLADPSLRQNWADALKYLSLDPNDPLIYLSFGLTVRERVTYNDAPNFGLAAPNSYAYLLHRFEAHVDAHIGDQTRIFLQLENALAPGLAHPGPADTNKADIRLLFLDGWASLWGGTWRYRIGRQEMAFDLQRFVSVRDGPNVRQAYDALWTDYERGRWRFSGFVSQPVVYRNATAFDDTSSSALRFGGVRAQRIDPTWGSLSATYSFYNNANAHYATVAGYEHRDVYDLHHSGKFDGFDWDNEAVEERGTVARDHVNAWAVGLLGGYTFQWRGWNPRVGLQADAASGNRNPGSDTLGTFNPLFPNGAYLTLSGYTGYSNFIHLKPSLTFTPLPGVKILTALGRLWRETTADAVYMQPMIPLARTAGQPGSLTASYVQFRVDYAVTRSLSLATEYDHYWAGPVVVRAGGHDSDYANVELRWGW